MKQLSIEEKAKRYDKAIEKAKKFYNDKQVRVGMTPIELEEIFPEFKESEGEKIRKVLIGWINLEPSTSFNDTFDGFSKEQILAWIEKQGEHNPTWSEEDEEMLQGIWDEILANKHEAKEYEWKTYDKFLDWLKSLKDR